MAISSIGVGSGLPLDQLLADLEADARKPLSVIKDRQTITDSRISAYGLIKSAVEKLQTAGTKLAKLDTFNATKTSVTGDAVTVSSDGTAIAGNYSIEVQSLASHQMMVAAGRADRTTAIGSGGTIAVTLENGDTAELELGEDTSLNGLMEAINKSDLGIKATLVNDGDPDAPYRLLLTASGSGTAGSVASISVSGNTELAGLIGYDAADPGAGNLDVTAATDAEFTINGIEISSSSNTVQDVIQGVTLTLESTTSSPATLKITQDASVARNAIQGFVDAYNSLQSTIRGLTAYDADKEQASVLTGDSLARTVQARVREVLNVNLGGSADIANLSQLGISTNPTTGQLEIDSDKLDAALADNPDAVAELFAGENGVGARIDSVSKPILDSNGIIASATATMEATAEQLATQYSNTEERIASSMERYRQQFIQLDSMVAQMNSLSTYLTQQLSMLGNLNSSNGNN